MRALIVGAGGQVGRALVESAPAYIEMRSATHSELNIADEAAVRAQVAAISPDVIINAAAYTAVDRAESEPETAQLVNVRGPLFLAQAAHRIHARLLHVSSDFVFDGASSRPYKPDAPTNPLSMYGRTKRDGESAVLESLGDNAVVLRTSWIYAREGNNFVGTMLRLMADRGAVRVVADQIGTPTAAHSVADVLWTLVGRKDIAGIRHWSDAGVASWYDFACAIHEEARALGLLASEATITPITTEDYPTAARRPAYSVLDKTQIVKELGVAPVHWRSNLRVVLRGLSRA